MVVGLAGFVVLSGLWVWVWVFLGPCLELGGGGGATRGVRFWELGGFLVTMVVEIILGLLELDTTCSNAVGGGGADLREARWRVGCGDGVAVEVEVDVDNEVEAELEVEVEVEIDVEIEAEVGVGEGEGKGDDDDGGGGGSDSGRGCGVSEFLWRELAPEPEMDKRGCDGGGGARAGCFCDETIF